MRSLGVVLLELLTGEPPVKLNVSLVHSVNKRRQVRADSAPSCRRILPSIPTIVFLLASIDHVLGEQLCATTPELSSFDEAANLQLKNLGSLVSATSFESVGRKCTLPGL